MTANADPAAARAEAFDAVVVGSGFGGSVMAYRLAEAGRSVCVLERGKDYPPGSFARSPAAMARNFWDPSDGVFGLFNVWSFDHIDVIVSAGLGGGSLIYANVMIRKDEHWFFEDDNGSSRPWPVSRPELEPRYDAVEQVIRPQVFPGGVPAYSDVAKFREFRHAAGTVGFEPTTHDKVDPKKRQCSTRPRTIQKQLGEPSSCERAS